MRLYAATLSSRIYITIKNTQVFPTRSERREYQMGGRATITIMSVQNVRRAAFHEHIGRADAFHRAMLSTLLRCWISLCVLLGGCLCREIFKKWILFRSRSSDSTVQVLCFSFVIRKTGIGLRIRFLSISFGQWFGLLVQYVA